MKLKLASDLSLPLDLVTESIAVLARKRAGKSYTARRLVEELHRAGQQVVVMDPKGDWWGIRSSRDGRGPGLPFVILGGERGDMPLEVGSGELVAQLAAEERASILLDLSDLRKKEVATFSAAFLETLYRLKRKNEYRTPMMLVIDEADAIAPQRPMPGEERMLGAAEDIVRRGGQRGIGSALVTQRAAVLNKNVLTQTGVLILLQTMGSQDIAALDEWIKKHGRPEEKAKVLDTLATMPVGTAWFWAPYWEIFKQVKISQIDTFDSGATPRPGERRVTPKTVADVDLAAFRKQMAATIERAAQDDPKVLRRRITELQREISQRPKEVQEKVKELRVEVPALKAEQVKRLERAAEQIAKAADVAERVAQAARTEVREILDAIPKPLPPLLVTAGPGRETRITPLKPRLAPSPSLNGEIKGDVKLGSPHRKILTVLAQYPDGRTVTQIALLTGYAVNGGAFRNPMSALRSAGYIEGQGTVKITDAGLTALGVWEPLPLPGRGLLDYWMGRLGGPEREIVRVLKEAYPKELTAEEIASQTRSSKGEPYDPDGGAFRNPLSRLRTLEIVEGRGRMKLTRDLVEVTA